jgi:dipeptide/tripeptide permease
VVLFKNPLSGQLDYVVLTDLYSSGIHLAWQLIQIFVMALAEVFFAISALTFAFLESPASLKSSSQSLYFVATGLGNLILIVVAVSRLMPNQLIEYIFFAALMAVAMAFFIVLTLFYKYRNAQ